jgi:hypothetical protein
VANVRHRSRTVAIEVCLTFNFAVVFILMYFCFRRVKHNVRQWDPNLQGL